MSDSGLLKPMQLGLALIVIASLAILGLNVYQIVTVTPQLSRNRALVTHTFDVILTAQALGQSLRDAERNQQGFLITNEPAYLEPYRKGIQAIHDNFSQLQRLTFDNPEQQRRWLDLENLIETRIGFLERAIEARRSAGFDAARQIVQTNVGVNSMERIDVLLGDAIMAERELLTQRLMLSLESESSTRHLAVAGSVAMILTLGLGILIVIVAVRNTRRLQLDRGEAERRFDLLVQNVTEYAIFMLDKKGHITTWNAGAERIKGYSAAEAIGSHFERFFTPEDRASGLPQKALETAAREGKFEMKAWRVRKDGTRFMSGMVLSPIRDERGELVGYAKVTRDLTRELQQSEQLDQARTSLAQAQKMEALGQLTGGVAHDFNNMLTIIKSGVTLLESRLKDAGPDITRLIEGVQRGVTRGASLTQHLLAFARRQPLDPQPLELNRLIAGMSDLLKRSLNEGVAVEIVQTGGLWRVYVDANQLEQAILNLVINARDAMPAGGNLTLETANAFLDDTYAAIHAEVVAGQYVMIGVSDTGTGMTAETAAKAIEPFFTTKGVGQGTGLGLSQVHGFVKQSGGHIKIYSEPGQGTTVKLYLPRFIGPDDRRGVTETPGTVSGEAAKETILVVEDDADVRVFTAEMLGALGYRVLSASDARSALDILAQESHIDLLFTDVGLPGGVNGRQLADEARRRRPALKVLYTTGYARNAIIHGGTLDPGVELIVKPFSQADLGRKIRQILDRAPMA